MPDPKSGDDEQGSAQPAADTCDRTYVVVGGWARGLSRAVRGSGPRDCRRGSGGSAGDCHSGLASSVATAQAEAGRVACPPRLPVHDDKAGRNIEVGGGVAVWRRALLITAVVLPAAEGPVGSRVCCKEDDDATIAKPYARRR